MEVRNFEDLEIWKDARLLTKAIYRLTQDARFAKDYALRDQIRRAAVSIMSAIKSLFSFCMLPKRRAGKFVRNFTRQCINLT